MRILIPNYSTPDSFEENVAVTLEKMGHEVRNMGPISIGRKSSPYVRIFNEVKSKLLPGLSRQEKWLLQQVREFKPQVVICLTQTPAEEVLFQVRRAGVRVVAWWGDTAANMNGKGLCHPEWDLIFIKDHYAAFKLKSLGLPAFQLYEAMNPLWHKPLAEQSNDDVVIAGSFYDYRHYLVSQLMQKQIAVSLYGARMPMWAAPELKQKFSGKFITREEKSRIFGAGLAVLNSTAMREFSSVNCRAFEIAGAGGLQIMEYRDSIKDCFEIGKEILIFQSVDELLQIIDRARRFPNEMKTIRAAAAHRALTEHTYEHRLKVMLDKLKSI